MYWQAAATQTALFVTQAEAFTREMERMSKVIDSLQLENQQLREAGASGGAIIAAMGGGDSLEAELRAKNEQLEVEIKSIKSNNVRSMQKLMKELNAKDRLLKEHGVQV